MSCHRAKPAASRPAEAAALTPDSAAAGLVGVWEYVRARAQPPDSAPTTGAGLHVALAIDSIHGNEFVGHVARWLSGDMGARPGTFALVRGIATGRDVRFTIPFARSDAEPIAVRAMRAAPDTLAIVTATGALAGGGCFVRLVNERR